MEKTDKNVKKTGKKLKIKRITGQKPSKISKNRQKCQKTWKKASKISKNCQKCKKKKKDLKNNEKSSGNRKP